MSDAIAIHGHDIINLVSTYPDGIRLSKPAAITAIAGSAYTIRLRARLRAGFRA